MKFFNLFKRPEIAVAQFNGHGPAPEDLTWEYASKKYRITPFTRPPTECATCHRSLVTERHDYNSELEQYMVIVYACPNEHGFFVECA